MTAVEWFDLGYTDLIPVAPPGARIAPQSKLRPEVCGKAPAIRRNDGWTGCSDWHVREFAPEEIDRMQGSIGLRTTRIVVVDLDILDQGMAQVVRGILAETIGLSPAERCGRAPKTAFLYWAEEPMSKIQLRFQVPGSNRSELVELLGEGQQLVIDGIHPGTGRPYRWLSPPPLAEELPPVTLEQVHHFFSVLEERLDMVGAGVSRAGDGRRTERPVVDQESLRGDLDRITAIMQALPNPPELFPTRDHYMRVGYAVKASLPDHPVEAYQLWWTWANRWPAAIPHEIEADWGRMHGPYSVGASYLYSLGRAYAGIPDAHLDFDVIPDDVVVPDLAVTRRALQHTDIWFGEELVKRHGNHIRYDQSKGLWYGWSEDKWVSGAHVIREMAKEISRQVSTEFLANKEAETKAEGKSHKVSTVRMLSAQTVTGMMSMAQSDRRISITSDRWDADPDLLGIPGGVVDLRTGEVRPADPNRLMTRSTTVRPSNAGCPVWEKFIDDCTGGDKKLAEYYRRAAGYCLTGQTREQVFFYMYGPGGNGKGTFANTLARIIGGYAAVANMSLFLSKARAEHPTSLAALCGARLVLAQELQAGQQWDEQILKMLTGGDKINARFLYQDEFSYFAVLKLLFSGNHLPRIGTVDPAMQRRTQLWPFDRRPPVVDTGLQDKLLDEYGAILRWAIDGATEWYKNGLQPPEAVISRTQTYMEEEDITAQWLQDCCVLERDAVESMGTLYESYERWSAQMKLSPVPVVVLSRILGEKGFGHKRTNSARHRTGLRVKQSFESIEE